MNGTTSAIAWLSLAVPDTPVFRAARKGAAAIGIKLIGAGVVLGLQVLLARLLGPVGYGEYAFAFGWLQVLLVFAQGGFSTAALRFVGEYRAQEQAGLLNGFMRFATRTALSESIVIAVCAAMIAVLFDTSNDRTLLNFVIACAALPALSQFLLHSTFIRGFGEAIASMLVGLIHPVLLTLVLLTFIWPLSAGISSTMALSLNLGVAMCALAIVIGVQRHFMRTHELDPRNAPLERRNREWFTTATQMMFASGMFYLHARTGVVITGLLLDATSAGTYALVERIADSACLGLMAVNLLAGPSFAALYAQGRQLQLQRYARLAAIGATAVMLISVVPIAFMGRQILGLFGEEFVAGYSALLVLLIAAAVSAMTGSAVLLLGMTGEHRANTVLSIGGVGVNLLLSLLLIPRFGLLGTAMANATSLIAWNLALVWYARKRLGIWTNVGRLASLKVF
jgi:O-antigen/teichoic acid export membrane protein